MPEKKYKITPLVWLVRDEASVRFHVKSDDYFGTIATILSLARQQAKKNGRMDRTVLETFNNLENDLLFLQRNYQIKPKAKNRKRTPKGKLKSQ